MKGIRVVACCDCELLGKVVEQGDVSFKVEEGFYGRNVISASKLAELIQNADSINLLGEKAVGVALRKGFINERDVIRVKGIPHVQIFKI